MLKLLLVFLGGGVGSLARNGDGLAVARVIPATHDHPRWGSIHLAGTLAANVLGCLLIGLAWGRLGIAMREETRLLLITGFLGGFTTFSAIGWETLNLVGRGRPLGAAAYVAATLALGFAAVWIGFAFGKDLAAG